MSERIQTPITGITTTSDYTEGDTYSLVNLRPQYGALHPVSPRKILQELSQKYDIVFVHQNNDYKNWLGVINDDNYSSVYWDVRDEQPQAIASYISGKINSVQQIGNTISLITEDNIFYLFYQNGKYIYLGEIPQVPAIRIGTSDVMSHAEYYFVNEYGSGTVTPDNFIDSTKGLVNKAIDVLVNGGTNSNGDPIGGFGLQLFDAHYIRYAFRLYDGSLTKHSPPILVMPVKNILDIKTIDYDFDKALRSESKVDVYGYRMYLTYDFSGYGNWKDIVKSVDIFMSPAVGISNIENIRKDMPTSDSPRLLHFNLIKELTPEALKSVANNSNFYFIKSIELGKSAMFDAEPLPSDESDISKMENLIYQELMSDDNFSNHKYGASCSYAYNNRLHIGNIKTTFFKGFNISYFQWQNNYNGIEHISGQVNSVCIEVEIHTGISLEKVYSYFSDYIWAYKLFASAFISYPDTRAKRITIYEVTRDDSGNNVWTKVFTAPLESHNLLNLAYYLNDGLKPIEGIVNPNPVPSPNTSKIITLTEPNKIKVSDLNNPLSFPNTNVYLAGNGIILAMATNAMNVSDRNYGQYPLYVFTSQGIWTLNVGSGEVVYSTQSAPTYTEAPTTSVVCSVPFGVVFTTQRGLMVINGQSVDFISPQIEQPPVALNIETSPHCDNVVFNPELTKFSELLGRLSNIIYNPFENELIVNIPDTALNYVLNFNNQLFYQSTERIDLVVGNVFPELFVVSDKIVKDYASSEQLATHVSLILRPLKYGIPDIKRLERMILRGILYNVKKPLENKSSLVMTHAANDNINFPCMRGLRVPEGNLKDRDMGLFGSTKYRQYLFTFAGLIDDNSQIQYLESMVDKEYNNSKMR